MSLSPKEGKRTKTDKNKTSVEVVALTTERVGPISVTVVVAAHGNRSCRLSLTRSLTRSLVKRRECLIVKTLIHLRGVRRSVLRTTCGIFRTEVEVMKVRVVGLRYEESEIRTIW